MLDAKHKHKPNILKFAFIEAVLEYHGHYNSRYMAEVFGNHPKDAVRVLDYYRQFNPGSIETVRGIGITQSHEFERKALKKRASAEHYLNLIQTLYGSVALITED